MKDYFNQFGFSRTQHIVTWFSRCADNQLTVIKHHRASNEKHFMTTFITVIKFKLIFQLSEIFNHKSLTKLSRSFSGANNASSKNILSHDMGKGCSFLFVDYQFRFSSLRKKKNNDLHLQLLYYIKKLHFKYEQVGTLIYYLIR